MSGEGEGESSVITEYDGRVKKVPSTVLRPRKTKFKIKIK